MNVLMIGAGMVARTHLLALRDNGAGARLDAVIGRSPDCAAAFAQDAGEVLGYPVAHKTTLDAALARMPDLALLITPPDARTDICAALAQAGIPTLMEKPVARNLVEARGIIELYAAQNVTLGLCFQHRTRSAARALRDKLHSGVLGQIVHIEMRVPWWRDQSYYDEPGRGTYGRDGGGVMISQAIHTLDLALWLAGPVTDVQAHMRTSPMHVMEAEDIATAILTFASGASGLLSATTAAYPGGAETITILTTKGQATLKGDHLRIDHIDGTTDIIEPDTGTGTGGGADPMAFTHAWHQSVIEDFAEAVRTRRTPLAPPQEALHVHAVIDAMERAAKSGKTESVSP